MPIRKITVHACVLGVTLASPVLVSATDAPWNGSYSAEGQCFCSGVLGREIDSKIVPTPVGGQSVSQVCSRIGEGPTLLIEDGKYNFPVFKDAQCGNGPAQPGAESADAECVGSLGVVGEDCVGVGPKWDLKTAFSKPAAKPALGIKDTLVVTGGSRYITPQRGQATDDSSSVAGISSAAKTNKPAKSTSTKPKRTKPLKAEPAKTKTVVKAPKQTAEEIRARQLVQIEAARERAKARELLAAENAIVAEQAEAAEVAKLAMAAEDAKVAAEAAKIAKAAEARKADLEAARAAKAEAAAADAEKLAKAEAVEEAKRASAVAARIEKAKEAAAKAAKAGEAEKSAGTVIKPTVKEIVVDSKQVTETQAESVAQSTNAGSTNATLASAVAALKLPVSTRNSAREFDYIEGQPVNYDFGGAGMSVAASTSSHGNMQYLMKASAADTYQEAFIGVGYYLSPETADRLTVLLSTGIEYGKFKFQRGELTANRSETGVYLGLSSRFVVNNRFELQAGVGYSTFFEGDGSVFGSAFYHLTPSLDLTTKAEAGDNDVLGFGIRYYY